MDDDRVDDDGCAGVALNVGQRLDQDLGSFDHWMERGSEDRHSALKNVTGQVFVLHNRVEPLMNVGGVDRDLVLGKLGRAERKVLEQPFKYCMETAGADVFRAGIDLRGDFGQGGDRVVGEVDVDLLGLQQRNVLLGQRVFGLRQDAHEIVLGQRLELDADREAALKLRNKIGGLG